ncbi:hypothetical protein PPACK8108_LOCUS15331 [Phakopsora pachyrhizi]|uniref:Uncharacterized protein n=1 Tax=Phakopsora pachyrhizi TaxID=170000 RepID=A0AAV0B6E0_PHAPC|nr:hypothetical protein PPACK8108_LOCUS15331 [Phakopsora pachyrhizi]
MSFRWEEIGRKGQMVGSEDPCSEETTLGIEYCDDMEEEGRGKGDGGCGFNILRGLLGIDRVKGTEE